MERNAAELLSITTSALRAAGVRRAGDVAEQLLGAISDHVFDGATRDEVRADLRTLREEGLDGPVMLFSGLLPFGQRDRGGAARRRAGAEADDQVEDLAADDDDRDETDEDEDDQVDDLGDDEDDDEDDDDDREPMVALEVDRPRRF